MIQPGNLKLGALIHGYSLPPEVSCPGASPACIGVCYGQRGHYYLPNVQTALTRNFAASKKRDFVPWMTHELREKFVQVFRPHVVGDYYRERYIRKWIAIVKRSPRVTFYSYTRTWAVPDYYDAIVELGRLPNMQMWFSFDKDMPVPPRLRGFKRCYLSLNDDDQPPRKVDLVFRNRPKTVMKKAKYGSLVCPYENGVTKTNCSKCGVCWREVHERNRRPTKATVASRAGT